MISKHFLSSINEKNLQRYLYRSGHTTKQRSKALVCPRDFSINNYFKVTIGQAVYAIAIQPIRRQMIT